MMIATMSIRLFLSVILFRAALHKLRDHKIFQMELAAYQLLPKTFLPITTLFLVVMELAASASLMNLQWATGLWLAALLFIIYAAAMMINLLKGMTDIDCGCGGPFANKKIISWSLVIRNLVLAFLALLCALPQITTSLIISPLHALDVFIILAGTAVSLLIYEAIEQAIANAQGYRRWRSQQGAAR